MRIKNCDIFNQYNIYDVFNKYCANNNDEILKRYIRDI